MAAYIWSGVKLDVQSAIGATKTISAISKANPGVVTSTSHGLANGDYVYLAVQGMIELDQAVRRVANVTANTFELEGVDTTSFGTFTSGTAQLLTFGTTMNVISNVSVSGGEFDEIDITTVHDLQKKTIPGAASAIKASLTALWDPADAGLIKLKAASDAKQMLAFRFTLGGGAKWVFMGYVGATLAPTGSAQSKVETPISVTAYGKPSAYAT